MKRLRLMAVIEANTVTGPAKNLLQFAQTARVLDLPFEVCVATFHRPGDPEVFAEAAAKVSVEVHQIEESRRFDRSVIGALTTLARSLKPDIVQTHAVKSHLMARLAGLDRLAPWVAFHHGYTWTDRRAQLYNQLDRWSLRPAPQAITVSEPFRRELEQIGVRPARIAVVHNAVDPAWGNSTGETASALRFHLGIPEERRIVLIVGRLSREKDHLVLLDALGRVHREGHVAPHLVIVGDGPELRRIEARARALSLTPQVTFTGQAPSAEPYYAIADVVVLSSRTEGSPNALLEAMAARVPVVATAVGGVPEIVTDGESARLVPPGDSGSLAEAIEEILTDPGLAHRLARRARELAETRYSPEARAARLADIYRNLLKQDRL